MSRHTLTVYLSSTLADLKEEREAVQQVLRDQCVVKHSYRASEQALVESCLDDVAACDLYIAIVGLRYGFVPAKGFPNPENLSITELEYRHAGGKTIPRLVFVKDEKAIAFTETDYKTKENPAERIEAFRQVVAADQRPMQFATIQQLREEVLKAFNDFRDKAQARATRQARTTKVAGGRAPAPPGYERVRRDYVEWLCRECEKVVLLGLDLRDRRQDVRLGQVYVPALTPSRAGEENVSSREVGRGGRQDTPLLHRLGEESLYVPGAPGSGKSTFCRWVALTVATGDVPPQSHDLPPELRESMPPDLRGRFPFLCPLRQWAADARCLAGNGTWLRKQLEAALAAWIDATNPGGLTSGAFLDALARQRAILVFDGVDEIPERIGEHRARSNFLTGLADALPQWLKNGHRVLLTSRPHALEDSDRRRLGLAQADLSGLPRELQDVFVRRWYAAANVEGSDAKARGLVEHLDGRPDLDELRPNPMLLTALCVKYDEDLRLPGDLYRLYDAVTNQVLFKRFPTEAERDLARLRLSAVALAMHEGSPSNLRTTPAAEVSLEEVDDTLRELAITDRASERGLVEAAERRESLLSSSGLLLSRPNRRAAFYHLSFQEFLAAVRVRRVADGAEESLGRHMATPEWRRTLRFLFCAVGDQASPERALREYSVLLQHLEPERLASDPNPALLLADCLEVGHARGWSLHDFARPFRQACEAALTRAEPPARAHLWQVLGRIGLDNRPGVGVKDGVPDIAWADVPGGPFKFGEQEQRMILPLFRIARYPITNAQFQAFIDDGGFERDEWWRWLARRKPPAKTRFPHSNHPRETVSWFDAMAFCAWLEARLRSRGGISAGQRVRLPSEMEWEKAARGTDGREYPWVGGFESGRANIDETFGQKGPYYLRHTSAVGIYPLGSSPCGADDMSGNVWVWCSNPPDSNAVDDDEGARRVVRGGSWFRYPDFARASSRIVADPDLRYFNIGFRVVCVSPIRSSPDP